MGAYYLMMDVGGNGIKAGVMDETGKFQGEIQWFPARAKEDHETIFSNFADIIAQKETGLPDNKYFSGIGMAFPGPFDYLRGVSLMRGLDKYDAIFGMDIQEEIKKRLPQRRKAENTEGCRFLFLHDVEAFALGACIAGPAADCRKVFCLCIGTGAGSAFLDNGNMIKDRKDIPANGWIYKEAFRDGVIDDYLSTRGLMRIAGQHFESENVPDGAELSGLAAKGDPKALAVFCEFGRCVEEAVIPFLKRYGPDGCLVGGQIAKSFSWFGEGLIRFCEDAGIKIYPVSDTPRWTLTGLYEKFCREEM